MKTNPDPERENALLDTLLRDETWQTASTGFKAEALRIFQARQRVRRLTRWAGSVAASAALIAGAVLWLGRSAPAPRQVTVAPSEGPKAIENSLIMTDQDLVAAFPKGSCFIAEVDGRKELIFLDPKAQQAYVARPGDRSN